MFGYFQSSDNVVKQTVESKNISLSKPYQVIMTFLIIRYVRNKTKQKNQETIENQETKRCH